MKRIKLTHISFCCMLAILVLAAFTFIGYGDWSILAEGAAPTATRGQQALNQLKIDGGFDSLSRAYAAARYEFEEIGSGISVENPSHRISARFDEFGVANLSGELQNSEWALGWKLKSIGSGHSKTSVGAGSWKVGKTKAELLRPEIGVTEYFENRPDGLEQGWIVNEKPPGDGDFTLVLQASGELKLKASADGQKIILSDASGTEVLHYEKLKVWDADQKILTARMLTDEEGEVRLEVEDANAVYPLTIDPVFVQKQELLASDGGNGDEFGSSVAISGDTAVIGAPFDFVGANGEQGSAYVFVRSGNVWTQQAKLTALDGAPSDHFGNSVSIDAETIIVGAYNDDTGSFGNLGSAYVFVRSGNTWAQQAKLAPTGATSDLIGNSVDVSGDTAALGAPGNNIAFNDQGAVYVFVRSGSTWTQQQKVIVGTSQNAGLGYSVAISGNTMIAGAPFPLSNGLGDAFVFSRSGTTWSQQANLTPSTAASDDKFGYSVDITVLTGGGAIAVVGAPVAGFSDAGQATIFNGTQAGVWTLTRTLSPSASSRRFGVSVAIAPTSASSIVVGADEFRQRVFIFRQFNSIWRENAVRSSVDLDQSKQFGHSVALTDETLIVGANLDNIQSNVDQGSAYLFRQGSLAPFDFDSDAKTDVGIFRPSTGSWWIQRSIDNQTSVNQFGVATDLITPADFSGDGRADVAVWRPSTGQWFVFRSEDLSFYAVPFGMNGDVPVPADYDADGKADLAIFRPSSVTWFISKSGGGTDIFTFGLTGDKPVPGDFDGDGKADIAIFRPNGASGSEWWIRQSGTGATFATQFGTPTDKTVPGDYTGDGKTDIAFWRPSNGNWFVLRSEDLSFFAFPFGINGDVPVPGDYDGDGRSDAAIYRPSNLFWYVQKSTGGNIIQQFGAVNDVPVPNAFVR